MKLKKKEPLFKPFGRTLISIIGTSGILSYIIFSVRILFDLSDKTDKFLRFNLGVVGAIFGLSCFIFCAIFAENWDELIN